MLRAIVYYTVAQKQQCSDSDETRFCEADEDIKSINEKILTNDLEIESKLVKVLRVYAANEDTVKNIFSIRNIVP